MLDEDLATPYDDRAFLKSQLETITATTPRLFAQKPALLDAFAAEDLEKLDALLTRTADIELGETALAAELRAQVALIRGEISKAYELYSTTADRFAWVDPAEPVERKARYALRLYQHGLRHGGVSLSFAALLNQSAVSEADSDANKIRWAEFQNTLGRALQDQGSIEAGPEGFELLEQAVCVFRQAQDVYTRSEHPVDWAMIAVNIAVTEMAVTTRPDVGDPSPHFAAALEAVDGAMEIFGPGSDVAEDERSSETREVLLAAMEALGQMIH